MPSSLGPSFSRYLRTSTELWRAEIGSPLRPETKYARSGDVRIAYQAIGDGPFDLLLIHGFVSNLEIAWEEPHLAQFLNRLASFSRLIVFDKRGTGLSDPVREPPDFQTRMDTSSRRTSF